MKRKIVVLVSFVVLAAFAGGLFYFWQDQKDVRELNKTLPKGVFVTKSLWGSEYKVVNKIDGYEFKVPKAWAGIEKIEYISKNPVGGYPATILDIVGSNGIAKEVSIDLYELTNQEGDLETWTNKLFSTFGLEGVFKKTTINGFTVLTTVEEKHLGGAYIYLMKVPEKKVYVFTSVSENFINEIILNGKW